ncbi:hypothetical protein [Xylophilus sp.]|uniref:hypothetical protein n=1 Tax=Xylophilus sp. TaxID=2653893 RepID=UPI0013BBF591|nr:hypothetical protein [Xylophilus sp.]KAF1049781.1 MAG: hypothetical protein GAK38_00444 [Xylophilus sp.]
MNAKNFVRWFSKRTLKGGGQTARCRAPAMPWGMGGDEAGLLLRMQVPLLRNVASAIVHVTTAGARA